MKFKKLHYKLAQFNSEPIKTTLHPKHELLISNNYLVIHVLLISNYSLVMHVLERKIIE